MNSKRFFYVLVSTIIILVGGVIASVLFGDQLLKKQTDKLLSLKLDSRVLDEQQTALVQANKDIIKYADLEKTAKTIVPQEKDQARVVRQIVSYATEVGVPIQNISFPSSNLGQSTAKPSTTSTTVPSTSQLKAVDGISGLYQMEINVQSDVNKPVAYTQMVDFLKKLENNRRTAQVTTISVNPDTKNRKLVTFTIVVNVYVKP